ncbi:MULTISPECIES: CheR family methyltransferase [Thermotoga]|jgi:chemotaxis protein methyltransferase CheR|uniref:CheR family methyltransferase n=1 Tax=Thermotoga TaxID=2335 RepID=UPI000507CDA1|nr:MULTISPECIES: protein-glutamate O-methyltransferase CheR [Thermotoga]KFZ22499.1 chemotactic methyltransferase [Thermotoga neapolitana LA10]MDK2786162.1 chemotaxis protein methyltransferase CheR [Thermotoga sp.]HBF11200.1 protein-glutamate O-methyltransferase CheR [Thermotoga neapolitana]
MSEERSERKIGPFRLPSNFEWKEFPQKEFEWFVKEVERRFGLNLSSYKPQRVKRRTELLLRKYNVDYRKYLEMLVQNRKYLDEFLDKMTINVTEFFRNPEKWWELRDDVIPLISQNTLRMRFWSAGCSSGEEPYSLAILVHELKLSHKTWILATDIDIGVLRKAQEGIYEERSLVNTPQEYVEKYFEKLPDGRYRIKDFVKKTVEFRRHDLLKDPFEKNLDLIVCRNVVIYFEPEAKNELYRKFAESLKVGGFLFVGNTERIFNYKELGFEIYRPFIYRKVK